MGIAAIAKEIVGGGTAWFATLNDGKDTDADSAAVPITSQRIGGNPKTLLDGVTANGDGATVDWEGGVATLMVYVDDGSNGGDYDSGVVTIWVKHKDATKWIQLTDAQGAALSISSDRILNFTLGADMQIKANVASIASASDPITAIVS